MSSGNWRLAVVGLTYKHSTLEEREPLQISREDMAHSNSAFAQLPDVHESLILSTCNRVEFYFTCKRSADPLQLVEEFYRREKGVDVTAMHEHFSVRKGTHVADHLFRVAAGIESMVIGENQIVGQLKDAYSSACAVKTAGKVIHRLFHQAFRVGKQVRSDTEMGKGACSVSSAAMDMLKSKMSQFEKPSVLFVGINRMIQLAAENLSRMDHSRFVFANRTPEVACEFGKKFGAEGYGLDRLPALLGECDVLVSCTSAKVPIVTRAMMDDALASRTHFPFIVVDLAIPRDVDFPKGTDERVDVNDLEDIKAFVEAQQHRREEAIPLAESIIERKLDEFSYWLDHVMHESLYAVEEDQLETLRAHELKPILDKLPVELRSQLDDVTKRLVSRVAHLAGQNPAGRVE